MQHQNLQMLNLVTRVLLKYIFYTVVAKQTVTLNLVRLCTHVYTAAHMRVVQLCTLVHCSTKFSTEYMYTHRRPPVGTKGDPIKIGTADWTPRETLE